MSEAAGFYSLTAIANFYHKQRTPSSYGQRLFWTEVAILTLIDKWRGPPPTHQELAGMEKVSVKTVQRTLRYAIDVGFLCWTDSAANASGVKPRAAHGYRLMSRLRINHDFIWTAKRPAATPKKSRSVSRASEPSSLVEAPPAEAAAIAAAARESLDAIAASRQATRQAKREADYAAMAAASALPGAAEPSASLAVGVEVIKPGPGHAVISTEREGWSVRRKSLLVGTTTLTMA